MELTGMKKKKEVNKGRERENRSEEGHNLTDRHRNHRFRASK